MSKTIFVNAITEKTGLTKAKAEEVFTALVSTAKEELDNNKKVALPGFGSFTVEHKNARKGRNPQTGEEIQIAAKNVVKFSAAQALKDQINDD